jgi:hypothetical protein
MSRIVTVGLTALPPSMSRFARQQGKEITEIVPRWTALELNLVS